RGPLTSPQTLETALQFVKSLGKLPVIAKDRPGFLVNRILLPYLVEAVWLFSEGVPAEQVDRVMLDFGMPMGRLRLCDSLGLDVVVRRLETLAHDVAPHFAPTDWLRELACERQGFYSAAALRRNAQPSRATSAPSAHVDTPLVAPPAKSALISEPATAK